MIVEQLRGLAVPINDVIPAKKNPRRGDVEAVARSLSEFGQDKPLVVRKETREIIKGNHTHAAAVSLGWQEIAVVWITGESEVRAHARGLADNRSSDLARYDHEELADVMQVVARESLDLLEAASFTQSDLDDLLQFIDPSNPEGEGVGGLDPEPPGDEDRVECPECGHIF